MASNQATEQIEENLRDAGCTDDFIQVFMVDLEQQNNVDSMRMLQKHRCFLLDHCHEWQKKIDCLDYLIYQMRKQKSNIT